MTIDGQETQVIDGSTTYSVTVEATDTLKTLRDKINALNIGNSNHDPDRRLGEPLPADLHQPAQRQQGELVIDTSDAGFDVQETVRAQDALLVVGRADSPATNLLVSSSTNTFTTS